ncbi:hypothetical protein BaRGS_00028679 [Batillaria attramentaria]|uniref:Uncharacterized protein n=1 Tax=Batillaria attramentaria TaxID=370345 RepID=A0ABD0JYF3_9CAEN
MAAAARQPRSLYLASPGSDYCVKVILLGDVGVGKTTILNTYTQGRPRVAHRASVSLSPSSRDRIVLYHDKKVKVSLWDTAAGAAGVKTSTPLLHQSTPRRHTETSSPVTTKTAEWCVQFRAVGESLGLAGAALAQFVLDSVRIEEGREVSRQEREAEREERRRKEERERQEREREREERRQKEEAERREREAERQQREAEREERRQKEEAERREREAEREERRQREEAERRERERLWEAWQVSANTSAANLSASAGSSDSYRVKLQPFTENDDIDAYLQHFERVATTHKWNRDVWAARLVPLLDGAARDTYLRLSPTDAGDYEKLKKALLGRFHRTAEYYRRQFREVRKESMETFEQFLDRLRTLLERWFQLTERDMTDVEEVLDVFLLEQLMATFTPELQQYVRDRWPKSAREAATIAHRHLEAKWASMPAKTKKSVLQNQSSVGEKGKENGKSKAPNGSKDIVCYKCHKKGHVRKDCKNNNVLQQVKSPPYPSSPPVLCSDCEKQTFQPVVPAKVNGFSVQALRDTGADVIAVSASRVKDSDRTGRFINMVLANTRHTDLYPTAFVDLESPFVQGRVEAVVIDDACHDVIIGNTATFVDGETAPVPVYARREFVSAVQTRAQARKEQEIEKPVPVVQTCGLDITPSELKELQAGDSTLAKARVAADRQLRISSGKNTITFQRSKGILKRVFVDQKGEHRQVCVPAALRKEVMRLAHDTPMGGHLGGKKTRERIWSEFYWPGMCADIRRYCQSCDRCQRITPRGRTPKVPSGQMPLVDQPFDRVAVDLVGPVSPSSERGNRFILTGQEETKTSSEYVLDLRNRIEETCAIARKSLEAEGVRQKKHFDKKAKFRTFQKGDRVLLLLPCKTNKLELAWRNVEERVGEADYKIKGIKNSNGRLMRWALQLQPYVYTVQAIPGQERYRSLTASYYRGAQACIIVFDVHNQASFDNARKLWLESIREYSDPDSLVPVLVGTYRNGDRALRQVTKQRAQKMASEYQLPYFEVDCHQDPKELEFVMDNLVTLVMSKASQNEDFSRSIKPQRSRLAPQKKEYKCRGCCPF